VARGSDDGQGKRASLRDVAELAQVSVRTVSNVVNDYPYVAEETRARVKQALEALDYRPNLAARSLRIGRTDVVALAVPVVDAPYFAELARELVNAAEQRSYTVLIEHTEARAQRERQLFVGAASQLIDGVILSPAGLSAEEVRGLFGRKPLVLLGERIYGHVADHVAIDNVAAARTATEHLLQIGRKRIAAIGCTPSSDSAAARLRYAGYEAALKDAGLSVDRALLQAAGIARDRQSALDRHGGALAMERLLVMETPPDAVFCYNDLAALGAIRTLYMRGFRVPEDVAVVGIDDIEDGHFSVPTLTTISPNKRQIAELALELLIAQIQDPGRQRPPQEVDASFELIVRESTAGRGPARQ
jgi:LacI family transcriptional regulator, repressor for deo operon, udp, cdd, tsx, nupC, and nupG